MNKVNCDICGTSYLESEERCPICGFSRDFKVEPLTDDEEFIFDDMLMDAADEKEVVAEETADKSVAAVVADQPSLDEEEPQEEEEAAADDEVLPEEEGKARPSGFLIAMLVIVIIALLGVTGYIFTRYYLPGMRADATEPSTEAVVEATEETPVPTVPCTSLAMTSDTEVWLDKPGNHWLIHVVAMPENTTDEIQFISNNPDVATVDADGTVTAVSEGSAMITVICGDMSVECNVTCSFVTDPSVPDVEHTEATETTAPLNEQIVDDGEVTTEDDAEETTAATEAPAEQTTEAPTEAETETPTEAETEAPTEEPTEEPTEAATEPADGLVLKLNKSDISFDRVGVFYTLKVTDGIDPKDVEWITSHSGVCVVEDGVITITGRGIAKITAKYKGQEATCIVRVSG